MHPSCDQRYNHELLVDCRSSRNAVEEQGTILKHIISSSCCLEHALFAQIKHSLERMISGLDG